MNDTNVTIEGELVEEPQTETEESPKKKFISLRSLAIVGTAVAMVVVPAIVVALTATDEEGDEDSSDEDSDDSSDDSDEASDD